MPIPDILALLPKKPTIRVVDVGAMALGEVKDDYQPLIDAGLADVIGFEPVEEEFAKLQANARPGRRYLPYAIGDGTKQIFHVNNYPMTSSLLRPNHALTDHFHSLSELMQVVKTVEIETRRLDDIPEVRHTDYIKLDIQGAELQVLNAGRHMLANTLMILTEVEFVPLYQDQPLFAEIDQFMRQAGFIFHRFNGMAGRPFRPFTACAGRGYAFSQMLWSDAVYVRDFRRLDALGPEGLLKLAVLSHLVCGSYDLAHKCLAAYDQLMETGIAKRYLQELCAPV